MRRVAMTSSMRLTSLRGLKSNEISLQMIAWILCVLATRPKEWTYNFRVYHFTCIYFLYLSRVCIFLYIYVVCISGM
jgi:hypothetical protein